MTHERMCLPGCARMGVMYGFMSQVIGVKVEFLMKPCSDAGGLAETELPYFSFLLCFDE